MEFQSVYNIVQSDGRTLREHNMDVPHKFPVDTLVELKWDRWHGDGACDRIHGRLWVVEVGRDCDGTPMYLLGRKKLAQIDIVVRENCEVYEYPIPVRGRSAADDRRWHHYARSFDLLEQGNFGEEGLTAVEVTEDLKRGVDALKWEGK